MERKILVADDDQIVRKTLTDLLTYAGHKVTAVPDGESAIAQYEGHDMLITDYNMGMGMTGIDVIKEIKKKHPDYKIFLMSSDTGDVEKEALKEGAAEFLSKPVYPDVLHSAIKKHLSDENQQPA